MSHAAVRQPAVPLLSVVLSQSRHKVCECDFTIICDTCEVERNIADCVTEADEQLRSYACADCAGLLVLIGQPIDRSFAADADGAESWWSIRPMGDLFVQLTNSRLTIPASLRGPLLGQPSHPAH
jgi:hypothetical protein